MPSADLDEAVRTGVTARCVNNGQSCIAAKRFILHHDIADEFEKRSRTCAGGQRLADPGAEFSVPLGMVFDRLGQA